MRTPSRSLHQMRKRSRTSSTLCLESEMGIANWLYGHFSDVIPYNGIDLRVNCPFCDRRTGRADTNHHMHVALYFHAAHCFRCEWRGSWTDLIVEASDCSFAEAKQEIEGDDSL